MRYLVEYAWRDLRTIHQTPRWGVVWYTLGKTHSWALAHQMVMSDITGQLAVCVSDSRGP